MNTTERTRSTTRRDTVVDAVVDRIGRRQPQAELAFDGRAPDSTRYVVDDILAEIGRSAPTVVDAVDLPPAEVRRVSHHAPDGLSCSVTRLELTSRFGIGAHLWIAASDVGLLSGIRLEVSSPTRLASGDCLAAALCCLDPDPAICWGAPDGEFDTGGVKDIASLSKLFVLDAVLRAVRQDQISLDDRQVIASSDVCPLSAGLSAAHIGRSLTVAELCKLMILRSDNTASDILLRLVGPAAVRRSIGPSSVHGEGCVDPTKAAGFMPMRELIEQAWGITLDPEGVANDPAGPRDLAPAQRNGFGHFVPLARLRPVLERIFALGWTPWPAARGCGQLGLENDLTPGAGPTDGDVCYKGGTAPGALAAMWYLPQARELIAVAVNNSAPYGALEDLYLRQCGEALLVSTRTACATDRRLVRREPREDRSCHPTR